MRLCSQVMVSHFLGAAMVLCVASSVGAQQRPSRGQTPQAETQRGSGGLFGGRFFAPIKSMTGKIFGTDESNVEKTPVNPPPEFDANLEARRRRRSGPTNLPTVINDIPRPSADPPSMQEPSWLGGSTAVRQDVQESPNEQRSSRESNASRLPNARMNKATTIQDYALPPIVKQTNRLSSQSSSRKSNSVYEGTGNNETTPVSSNTDSTMVSSKADSETESYRPDAARAREVEEAPAPFSLGNASGEVTESTSKRERTGSSSQTRATIPSPPSRTANSIGVSREIPGTDDAFDATNDVSEFSYTPAKTIARPRSSTSSQTNSPSSSRPVNEIDNSIADDVAASSDVFASPSLGKQLPPPATAEIQTDLSSQLQSSDGRLAMSLPGVRMDLMGPASTRINQAATYVVRASNGSLEQLDGLLVRVGIPPGVEVVSAAPVHGAVEVEPETDGSSSVIWQLPLLAANSAEELRMTIQTTQPEHFALDVEWTALPITGQLRVDVDQPRLLVALEGASEVEFGQSSLYRLRVSNPGNAVAEQVVVRLNAADFGSSETNIGDIPAGGERVVEVELTFQETGTIEISALAESANVDLSAETQIAVDVASAELVASWTGPQRFYLGSIANYDLALENTGRTKSQNIECRVKLPEGVEPISVPNNGVYADSTIRWTVAELGNGEKEVFPIRLRMNSGGDLSLQFTCNGTAGGKSDAVLLTEIESITDLKLTVMDPVAPAPIDSQVEYVLEVYNRGSKPATNVAVIAQFSEGIEPVRGEGYKHQVMPGQIHFEPIAKVGPGERVELKVIALASSEGVHRFRAQVSCDDEETQLVHEESTRYMATQIGSSTTIR